MKDNLPIEFNNISHSYGNLSVIQNFNTVIGKGEFVVIVGPSGCGKSTLLNLLSGYIKPVSGTVTSKGIIRTVYQQDGLFPWLTVSENISMGLRTIANATQRQQELRDLIELIHMQDFEHHYPHQLSGGMRQRVELARALAGDSDILLMDEPFSSLDYLARLRMRRELTRLLAKRARTVVFVTHDIEEAAQLADRVLILTGRPATICHEFNISVPHPRELSHPIVIHAMETILKELGIHTSEDPNISDFNNIQSTL